MKDMSWLEGGSTSKGHDLISLKLKAIAKCGDLMPIIVTMKSYLGAKGHNTSRIVPWRVQCCSITPTKNSICHPVPNATHIDPTK